MLPQLKAGVGELKLNSYYLNPYGTNRNDAAEHLQQEPFYCVLWFGIKMHYFRDVPQCEPVVLGEGLTAERSPSRLSFLIFTAATMGSFVACMCFSFAPYEPQGFSCIFEQ